MVTMPDWELVPRDDEVLAEFTGMSVEEVREALSDERNVPRE